MADLTGKAAVATEGASGLKRATAEVLAADAAHADDLALHDAVAS